LDGSSRNAKPGSGSDANQHLVIKAAGDGGAHEFLFGGADQHLLRECPCPVWILYRETAAKYRCIIAAVDLDPWREEAEESGLNELILEWAASLALLESATLHTVHTWRSVAEQTPVVFSSDLSDEEKANNHARERRGYHEALAAVLRNSLGAEARASVTAASSSRRQRATPGLRTWR
jgi:universal stress protein E